MHFGVNNIGLINVYAKDIALLPESHQRLWVAHNIAPEGGVSKELIAAQMECNSASTIAPEVFFAHSLGAMESAFQQSFRRKIFREHFLEREILDKVYRFQAINMAGVCSLAKEITRLVVDRFDEDVLKELYAPKKKDAKKMGSLKRFEGLLTECGVNGRKIMGPLVGVYELRHADAHLPSHDLSNSLELVGIQNTEEYINVGKLLIKNVAIVLMEIAQVIGKLAVKEANE